MNERSAPAGFDAPATYDAAADDYERAAALYWSFLGERTVERLAPAPGGRVLDVACGPGSSLLPAARRVGPAGRVVGVDLAGRMLDLLREKVRREGLANVELRRADMTRLPFADESFDVVQCVLGIFFAADMSAQAAEMWRLVRPGGRLAVTTFGERFLWPMSEAWGEAARGERPELDLRPPWTRANDPERLRSILRAGGATEPEVALETRTLPLASPDAWWPVVMGTGLRHFVTALGPEAGARVREHNRRWAATHAVGELTVDALYAVARKADS